MNRQICFVIVFALVLGFTQCKKEQPISPQSDGVMITLDITSNDKNDSRVDVNVGTGEINFEVGDILHVVSGGKHVGTLERTTVNNVTQFRGIITNPVENQLLYFYFFGNKEPVLYNNDNNYDAFCTVDISDQTNGLPLISMGYSTEPYTLDNASYTSTLMRNKCALMKFSVNTPSSAPICVKGMKNRVVVSFTKQTETNNGISFGMIGEGVIKMPAKDANNETWAIVLPQAAMQAGSYGTVYTADDSYMGVRPAMDEISANGYLDEGKLLTINTTGKITVSNDNTTVRFSPSNLQFKYQGTTKTWRFAEYQYEVVSENGTWNSDNWVDLFGWGTWGYGKKPLNLSQNASDYNWSDFSGSLGGYNDWRTLSKAEWDYIIGLSGTQGTDYRAVGIRYLNAKINANNATYNGLIIFPDNYSTVVSTIGLSTNYSYNNKNSDFTNVSASDWNKMEAEGAVFLPAGGLRMNTTVSFVGTYGAYWTSTYKPTNTSQIHYLLFRNSSVDLSVGNPPYYGCSVRLVRNVN